MLGQGKKGFEKYFIELIIPGICSLHNEWEGLTNQIKLLFLPYRRSGFDKEKGKIKFCFFPAIVFLRSNNCFLHLCVFNSRMSLLRARPFQGRISTVPGIQLCQHISKC